MAGQKKRALQGKGLISTIRVSLDETSLDHFNRLQEVYEGIGLKCTDTVILRRALANLWQSEYVNLRQAYKQDDPTKIVNQMKQRLKKAANRPWFQYETEYSKEELKEKLKTLGTKRKPK